MKSANEIAEEVWPYLHKTLFIELLKEARSDALEQAAKIAEDGMVDHELWLMENSDKLNLIAQHGFIANKIRQLKDKA